jgi:hypothetical protein
MDEKMQRDSFVCSRKSDAYGRDEFDESGGRRVNE